MRLSPQSRSPAARLQFFKPAASLDLLKALAADGNKMRVSGYLAWFISLDVGLQSCPHDSNLLRSILAQRVRCLSLHERDVNQLLVDGRLAVS
jgi:hypothetical protein